MLCDETAKALKLLHHTYLNAAARRLLNQKSKTLNNDNRPKPKHSYRLESSRNTGHNKLDSSKLRTNSTTRSEALVKLQRDLTQIHRLYSCETTPKNGNGRRLRDRWGLAQTDESGHQAAAGK